MKIFISFILSKRKDHISTSSSRRIQTVARMSVAQAYDQLKAQIFNMGKTLTTINSQLVSGESGLPNLGVEECLHYLSLALEHYSVLKPAVATKLGHLISNPNEKTFLDEDIEKLCNNARNIHAEFHSFINVIQECLRTSKTAKLEAYLALVENEKESANEILKQILLLGRRLYELKRLQKDPENSNSAKDEGDDDDSAFL